jgi:AcrR family transcriptional regulator
MTTVDAAEPGLRERKRRATRRAIQVAAMRLTTQHGLDGVTVDAISRAADISPRTFFNYFPSKEEAVLGDSPELPGDDVIEAFVQADGPLFDDLVLVIAAAGEPSMADAELVRLRHGLVKGHPHLLGMRIARMRDFEQDVASIIERRLARQHPDATADELQQRARLATLVAFGVMRHAWTRWSSTGSGDDLVAWLRRSFDEATDMLEAGTARIR